MKRKTLELKYHKAAYDLISRQEINPNPYLATLSEYEKISGFHIPEWRLWTDFQLLNHPIQTDSVALEKIERWEQKNGIKLPPSVREWYSLDVGLPLLYVRGDWWPHKIEELEIEFVSSVNYIKFISEQQAGPLCFPIDISDDPAVYWWGEEHHPDVSRDKFEPTFPSFSDFVHCFLWDWLASYQSKYGCSIYSIEDIPSLTLEDRFFVPLAHVRAQFTELPYECFGYHRFFSATQCFRMLPHPLNPELVGAGHFFASDEDSFKDLLSKIWAQNIPKHKLRASAIHDGSELIINSLF